MSYGCVYLITNLVNHKYYIGQTRNLARRIESHIRCKKSYPLAQAIQKYGWPSFSVEVLGYADSRCDLDNLERIWIITANSVDRAVGYNLKYGGRTTTFTPEVRARMSQKGKERFSDGSCNIPKDFWKGRPNPSAKKTWGGVKRGPMSDEHKKKLSDAHKGKPTGRTISPEMRAAMNAGKGPFTEAQRAALMKRSVGNKYNVGRKRPDTAERNRRAKCQF